MENKEINERVAKALGWKWRNYDPNSFELIERIPCYTAPNGDIYANPPNYSGSIEAAWEIMEGLGHNNGIVLTQHLQPPYGWSCTMWTPMTDEPEFTVRADTAPMAIALAFLKLKEGERD